MYKVEEGVEDDDNGKNGVLAITLGYKFAL